jgi:hypothetical protein
MNNKISSSFFAFIIGSQQGSPISDYLFGDLLRILLLLGSLLVVGSQQQGPGCWLLGSPRSYIRYLGYPISDIWISDPSSSISRDLLRPAGDDFRSPDLVPVPAAAAAAQRPSSSEYILYRYFVSKNRPGFPSIFPPIIIFTKMCYYIIKELEKSYKIIYGHVLVR